MAIYMYECKTIKEFIECCLFYCPTTIKNRFDALDHLFATLGNGIELSKNSYLLFDGIHPDHLKDPYTLMALT